LETLNQQLDSAEQALPDAAENTLLLDKLATQAATLSQQAQKCIDDHRQQNIQTQQAIRSWVNNNSKMKKLSPNAASLAYVPPHYWNPPTTPAN
jgi:CHAD domain-containing protein